MGGLRLLCPYVRFWEGGRWSTIAISIPIKINYCTEHNPEMNLHQDQLAKIN